MRWLKHSYASSLPSSMYAKQVPEPVHFPKLVLFNEDLANALGVASYFEDQEKTLAYLSGNELVAGSRPIAQAYAGHQFGHFNKLGDGRAILLGELETPRGLIDLQLKGSGRTPYSRQGDGRATLYSMLREYLISEAMYALGIPTSRSLAVVRTADKVYREEVQTGAVLSRIAASHIRVGTFEYARFLGRKGDLAKLLQYTIERHYPDVLDHPNHALGLLERVIEKQRQLIIHWLRVGFIHGVMNTDNMAISGETIDYGPCAFMNAYHPKTVFSSIDSEGRYAFGNQPNIAYWNLGVFANALIPLIDENEESAIEKIDSVMKPFPAEFSKAYFEMMGNKLGIVNHLEEDKVLIQECLSLLANNDIDYTNFFTELRTGGTIIDQLLLQEDFKSWHSKWHLARSRSNSLTDSQVLMSNSNPVLIPRNHLVEDALRAGAAGKMESFYQLLKDLSNPYDDTSKLQEVPEGYDSIYQTFCGT